MARSIAGIQGPTKMNRRLPIAAATLLAALMLAPAPGQAAVGVSAAHGFAPHRLIVKPAGSARAQTVALPRRISVDEAATALRSNPDVAYVAPDYIATASATEEEPAVPNDPGPLSGAPGPPGGWVAKQWNFLPWEGLPTPAAAGLSRRDRRDRSLGKPGRGRADPAPKA